MNLLLIGYRGTGKSAVARRLGLLLGWNWVDADVEIELRAGKSIASIFADEGETALETIDFSQTPDTLEQTLSDKRVRALADIICRDGDEPEAKSAALLVLMSSIEDSAYPKALANTAKHLAFARCGELNLYNVVEAQVATVESELLAGVL